MKLCPEAKQLAGLKKAGASYAAIAERLARQRGRRVYRHQVMNWLSGKSGMNEDTRAHVRAMFASDQQTNAKAG